jgi:hypothetical protein
MLHLIDDVLLSLWTRNIQLCNIHTLTYILNSEVWLRDDFNFPIVNFPFICSNISAPCEYGVCYSRLLVPIRISVIEDCYWKKYWTKSSWWLDLNDHFKSFTVVISTWLTGISVLWMDIICSVCLLVPHSWLKIRFIARVTLLEHELVRFRLTPGFKWCSPVVSFLCSIV